MKKMTSLQQISCSENRWVFRRLWDATKESASLIAGGGTFQSLGEDELEKSSQTKLFSGVSAALHPKVLVAGCSLEGALHMFFYCSY